jgi:effector-binding domain-containing protein
MTTEPRVDDRPAQPYVAIRTLVTMQDLGAGVIPQLHGEVMAWLKGQGTAPAGAPFIRYLVIDMERQLEVEIGWPVASAMRGNDRISAGSIPAGRYASLVYTGLDQGIAGNYELLKWGAKRGLVWDKTETEKGDAFGSRYESFLTDPADEPDTARWETEVAIRLADEQTQ